MQVADSESSNDILYWRLSLVMNSNGHFTTSMNNICWLFFVVQYFNLLNRELFVAPAFTSCLVSFVLSVMTCTEIVADQVNRSADRTRLALLPALPLGAGSTLTSGSPR